MNTIFDSTKLKLTGLYLIIIMFVTISFSFFIFSSVNEATERALESQRRKMEKVLFLANPLSNQRQMVFDPYKNDAILEIRERVLYNLIVINIVVFVVSGTLGYYLAERTLKPIEDMVAKQKRFISDAAHELKTPLTAIKTDLEVTLRDKKLTLSESKNTLERTVEGIDELSLLTANLLASSKYSNGDVYRKEIRTFDLADAVKKVTKRFEAKAKEKNIEITENLQRIKLTADYNEIEHVVMNILDNAIKYSNNDAKIFVSLNKTKSNAKLTIKDQGVGISKSNLSQIFEPFYRGDKSRTKSKTEGYGLGLAITKDIVESYGGSIEVQSELGKGSTFEVVLPLSA